MGTRDALIDTLFDNRYRILRRIGSGGMANVYLAEDETLGRQVAIKVLNQRYAEDSQFVERFLREASAAARLNHPNIVQVYDRGEADDTYYIAMEYVDGLTLKELISQRRTLTEPEVLNYSRQALNALRFAHRNGVVHRDVKPHNMMIDTEGRLKIADFGIARAGADSGLTEVGSIVGTAQYLSPEQARGEVVSASSDLYSLGVGMFEMATGRVPFEGDSPVNVALKHVNDPVPAPSSINPTVAPGLEAIILRAMTKDPAQRYQTADELLHDLDAVHRGELPSDTAMLTRALPVQQRADAGMTDRMPSLERSTMRPPPPPPVAGGYTGAYAMPIDERDARRRRWPWLLLALLVLALLGAGVWAATQGLATKVTVPDVVGQPQAKAEQQLRAKGFGIGQVTTRSSDNQQPGIVLDENPNGGAKAGKGSTVDLTVSGGPAPVAVPDLVGKNVQDARTLVEQQGLKLHKTERFDDKAPAGEVVDQTPKAGEKLARGGTVEVTVSKGKQQSDVPDVTGMRSEDARAKLVAAGFKVTVDKSVDGPTPENEVVSQSPGAGSKAQPGDTITLNVATGYNTVPDVVGLSRDAATAKLEGELYHARVREVPGTDSSVPAGGKVTDESPAAGTRLKIGFTVTITVQMPPGGATPPA